MVRVSSKRHILTEKYLTAKLVYIPLAKFTQNIDIFLSLMTGIFCLNMAQQSRGEREFPFAL